MLSGSQINGLGLVMPGRSLMAHPLEMSMLHAQVGGRFRISLRSCLHMYSVFKKLDTCERQGVPELSMQMGHAERVQGIVSNMQHAQVCK